MSNCLSNELRVRQRFGQQELEHRIPEHVGVFSVVEAELQLIKVGVKVLRANLMVATDDGALQEAPDVLKRVRVNVAPNVFSFAVLDRFVLGVLIGDTLVSFPFVGIDGFNIAGDVFTDEAVQGLPVSSPYYLQDDIPAALQGSYNDSLVTCIAAPLAFDLAAHEGFIGLDDALQQLGVNLIESGSDAMAEIPRCLVGHTERTLELVGRHALFALYNEVDCKKPFPQRKVGIVKDGASGNREAVAA
jgi:hypothetical protein